MLKEFDSLNNRGLSLEGLGHETEISVSYRVFDKKIAIFLLLGMGLGIVFFLPLKANSLG